MNMVPSIDTDRAEKEIPKRSVVEQFAMDYEMPMTVANCLVGKNEAETKKNIIDMRAYLSVVIAKYEKYRDGGYQ